MERYNAYVPVGLDPKFHVNGELTLGENIMTWAGTSIALKAYRLALKKQGIESLADAPVIDGKDRYSAFSSNARGWCTKSRPQH